MPRRRRRSRPPRRCRVGRSRRMRTSRAARRAAAPAMGDPRVAGPGHRSARTRRRSTNTARSRSYSDDRGSEVVRRSAAAERDAVVGGALAVDDQVAAVGDRLAVGPADLVPERPGQRLGGDHQRVDGATVRRWPGSSAVKPSVARTTTSAGTVPWPCAPPARSPHPCLLVDRHAVALDHLGQATDEPGRMDRGAVRRVGGAEQRRRRRAGAAPRRRRASGVVVGEAECVASSTRPGAVGCGGVRRSVRCRPWRSGSRCLLSATHLPTSSTVSNMARCIARGMSCRARGPASRGSAATGRAPATVASRGAEAGDLGFEDHDRAARIELVEVVGGPEPGVSGADDRDVGIARRQATAGAARAAAERCRARSCGSRRAGAPRQGYGRGPRRPGEVRAVKFGIFYELQLPRPWSRGRRVPAAPGRARPDRAGRPPRLRLRVGGRAPLPRGVLALLGARGVPRRGEPAHQEHPPRPRHHPAARPTTRPASPSGCRTLDLRQQRARRAGHRRGRAGHRAAPVRPPLPRQARGLGGRGAVPACRCSARRAGSTTASTSTSRCATWCPSRCQKPHPPLWVACSQLDTIGMAGRRGMGALGFQFVSRRGGARLGATPTTTSFTKRLEKLCRLPDQPEHRGGVAASCAPPTDEEARGEGRRAGRSSSSPASTTTPHGPVEPGTVNLWEEYQEWKQTPKGQKARRGGLIGSPETIRAQAAQVRGVERRPGDPAQPGGQEHATRTSARASSCSRARSCPSSTTREAEHQEWKRGVLPGEIELDEIDTAAVQHAVEPDADDEAQGCGADARAGGRGHRQGLDQLAENAFSGGTVKSTRYSLTIWATHGLSM